VAFTSISVSLRLVEAHDVGHDPTPVLRLGTSVRAP
jgi:hypothetical protein